MIEKSALCNLHLLHVHFLSFRGNLMVAIAQSGPVCVSKPLNNLQNLQSEFHEILSVGFLDASTHLYKRVCPSVGPLVRRSVGPSRFRKKVEIGYDMNVKRKWEDILDILHHLVQTRTFQTQLKKIRATRTHLLFVYQTCWSISNLNPGVQNDSSIFTTLFPCIL